MFWSGIDVFETESQHTFEANPLAVETFSLALKGFPGQKGIFGPGHGDLRNVVGRALRRAGLDSVALREDDVGHCADQPDHQYRACPERHFIKNGVT